MSLFRFALICVVLLLIFGGGNDGESGRRA